MALYQPGVSGNPNGRPKGARNKRTQEIFDIIEARGDKDPIDVLSDIITNTTNEELKVQACNILASYKHSKRSTAPTPRFIEEPTVVPDFTSVDDAENYLAEIPRRVGRGELDFQAGLDPTMASPTRPKKIPHLTVMTDRTYCRLKPTKTFESGHFLVRWLQKGARHQRRCSAIVATRYQGGRPRVRAGYRARAASRRSTTRSRALISSRHRGTCANARNCWRVTP